MSLEPNRFYAKDLIAALREAGFTATVEHTGGGTATLAARKTPEDNRILGGPGWYNWPEAERSEFTTDEFFIGEDAYGNDDEHKGYDPDHVMAPAGADIPALVRIFETQYAEHNQ